MDKPDKNNRLLLVEDDENFGMVLQVFLRLHQFTVDWAINAHQAMSFLQKNWYSLCIIDVMLPGENGFDLATKIRKIHPQQAFIFLTAKNLKKDIIQGYSMGAEDYLVKPFDSEILLFKVKTIINRLDRDMPGKESTIGEYTFDPESRTLSHPARTLRLSPKEAALLEMLQHHENRLLKREYALTRIWGNDSYYASRSMAVFINTLRKYLARDESVKIETIHGEGYRLRTSK